MTNRLYAVVLGSLALAFLLRVLGQALVAVAEVSFLPPMEEWFSGLMPYPVLLPVQVLIVIVQAVVVRDIWTGEGCFARARPAVGRGMRWFAGAYFAAMVVRYVAAMTLYPENRWFSGTIPIVFHWVLAAFLFVLGRYYASRTDAPAV